MEFCIATVTFWQSVGFNCDNWRKSIDNTKAIVHLPYALMLVPDAYSNENITVYSYPSTTLDNLLNSVEWSKPL